MKSCIHVAHTLWSVSTTPLQLLYTTSSAVVHELGAGVQAMWDVRLVASSHLYVPCEGPAHQGARLTSCSKTAGTATGRLGGGDGTTYSSSARMAYKQTIAPIVRLYSLLCVAHVRDVGWAR